MRIIYSITVLSGIALGFISLIILPKSPFIPFNWYGLAIFTVASIFFVLSFRFRKIGPYILFLVGILAMLNTYLYFHECSQIKGMELFGGFFISLAPLFTTQKKKTKKA
ncbi:MAG: hypothetical protein C0176_04660 [Mesoaciditoga sp.]|uniref:hypothetical protein n=1 Tax=Athalassotoga sp. TaxID=2022597 RepID=UPI000CAAB90F|nr:MAG: hypothetical protein C0176_04660 [Mesoaciditoga sp.]HEU24891.1 hypothetical protein [Mesoaciditoga lauensis]